MSSDAFTKVALIDFRLKDGPFASYLASGVIPIYIEHYDTYNSILTKIQEIGQPITHIVIAQHALGKSIMFGFQPPIVFTDQTTWAPLINLLNGFKDAGVTTVDFLACMLYSEEGVPEMFAEMEALTGINLRASTDDTGNPSVGGNWVLESDMADIQSLYFNASISEFQELFRLAYTSGTIQVWSINNGWKANLIAGSYTITGGITFTHKATVPSGTFVVFTNTVGSGSNAYFGGSAETWFQNGTSTPRSTLTLVSGTVNQLTGFQQGWNDDNSLHGATINTSGGTMYFNNADANWTINTPVTPPTDFRAAWFSPGVNPEIVTGGTNYISRLTTAVIAPVPSGALVPPNQPRFLAIGGGFGRQ